jgi:hypothetical protein
VNDVPNRNQTECVCNCFVYCPRVVGLLSVPLFQRTNTVTFRKRASETRKMTRYDPDKWIAQLMRCEHLPESDMKVLCDRVRAILVEESNIQPVSSPVTICGDIHGQFWDLLELLRKGGSVPETSYIFMARTWGTTEVLSR